MSSSIPTHGSCDPRFAKMREIFASSFGDDQEIGAAVCCVLDGHTVVDLWGGHCDEARTREWQRDTLVNVYSTTKGMTAMCAHQLIERGLLDPDAPVATYWPEFAAAGKQGVLVRWLLSHQAGLPAVRSTLPQEALFDWDRMCAALAAQEPWWTPGTAHGYHAFTYGHLVGELVRRITGDSLGTYFQKNIAGPLGADFHIGLAQQHEARVATMHSIAIGNRKASQLASGAAADEATTQNPMANFGAAFRDPNSMQYAALMNPLLPRDVVNTRAWRAAEIPAANGHGTARAVARIYGALARGGEIDGVRIMNPSTIARATMEEVSGPELLFCGVLDMRYGLGLLLGDSLLHARSRVFGHTGAGGSLGMADPDVALGFGFTMNCMQRGMVTAGTTATALIDALYAALR